MTLYDIITKKSELDYKLKIALSTMVQTDAVKKIYDEIAENQARCPHKGDTNYQFTWIDDTCPYCGKKHALE